MKALIVDDTKTLVTLIQVYLMGWDLQFIEASDGTQGLKKARETRPDLVISDVRMPGMDGFELCAAIRRDPKLCQIPVILLTSLHDEASRLKGQLVGATAFLTKPVAVAALRQVVSETLKLPEPRGALR